MEILFLLIGFIGGRRLPVFLFKPESKYGEENFQTKIYIAGDIYRKKIKTHR